MRDQITRKKGKSSIRKAHHSKPRKGTSADLIISHLHVLIPQVTGRLTNDKHWGALIMVDHASDFSYSHMVKCTSNEEAVQAKDANERFMSAYGHRVEAYHGDNSRFDSKDFQYS
eukprot:3148488-Ditylum_brightwellii.AAC.1